MNVTQDQLLTIERGTTGSKLAALLEQEKILDTCRFIALVIEITTAAQQSESGDLFFNGRENVARFIGYAQFRQGSAI